MTSNSTWHIVQPHSGSYHLKRNLSADDLCECLRLGSIAWTDFAYVDGRLIRLFEIPFLHPLLPALPGKEYMRELERHLPPAQAGTAARPTSNRIAPPSKTADFLSVASQTATAQAAVNAQNAQGSQGKDGFWFLQFEGSEFGPVSINELQTVIATGKIKGAMYAWRKGMENWSEVSNLAELSHLFEGKPKGLPPRPSSRFSGEKPDHEGRRAKRFSLVATAWWVKDARHREILGICSDVSATGMQVVLDTESKFEKGTSITIDIMPVGISGFSRFQVVGKVVWSNAEERRIGIAFTQIMASDIAKMERHVEKLKNSGG